ncbi:hypothetical protein METBIDRAFT_226333 [Metschnikowia bicuspidata var. bicuspidata NRRL YB-4993]|uniref:Uncharacterized protein n=1 Tax=Metschnikowia bicuspidata var. bicuspidata NRRL YB-4993 TaxID=869754 RepID=A0A1A0H1R7_9ASCO|nr:hypothetical protein METBIDRAFT_226333 [Metschnikowia bicuspidata var. bicuspidata NRRL YB-4993]OBA17971.1 hypothetical protein METBIDRAFT_226333 [Metschnikowia bicuspidata var. bicuspidata NRRL YB-4993]
MVRTSPFEQLIVRITYYFHMNETDTPDALLQQVPLIRNPAFQPPRPITLNTDYAKLLATIPGSVMPPKAAISREELQAWTTDLEAVERNDLNMEARDKDIAVYKEWLVKVQRKVAPGFDYEIMTPTKNGDQE